MNKRKFNREWIELNKKNIEDSNRRSEELLQIRREELYLMRKRSNRESQMLSEVKLKKIVRHLLEEILTEVDDEVDDEVEKVKT